MFRAVYQALVVIGLIQISLFAAQQIDRAATRPLTAQADFTGTIYRANEKLRAEENWATQELPLFAAPSSNDQVYYI